MNTETVTRDIPDAHISVVEDIGRVIKHVNNHQCASVSDRGIVVHAGAHINSWKSLIRDLYACWQAGEIRSVMIKFFIGDALNQGSDLYDESMDRLFGDLPWKKSYIDNIRWVCRSVPPEHRRLQVTWRFHQEIAPMSYEDQAYYISSAVHKIASGNRRWYEDVRQEMNDAKCREILLALPDAERQQWQQLYTAYKPTWNKLQQWISAKAKAPKLPMDLSKWIGETAKGDEELREKMYELYEGIKTRSIR